jgi:6-phospho-beta-glucosidase
VDRFTVLGGGSPFTVGLIDALLADVSLPPHELVLYGRNRANLDLVRKYALRRLGSLSWEVVASTELREALTGARYILHQIRYGGLEGRAEDEELASQFGAVADETLGPGALNAALRMAPALRAVAAEISATAPQAWVFNLTNPLSIAVAILTEEGVTRCVGLCELPFSTVRTLAAILDLPPDHLDWHYRGLNHRGFIVRPSCGGIDQLPRLLERLGNGHLGGIPAAVIADLRVVPTKYYSLLHQRSRPVSGRADFVRALSNRIFFELQARPDTTPTSLRWRRLDWYAESVVPTLAALHASRPSRQVVNLPCWDGLTREVTALVSAQGIVPEPPVDVNPRVRDLLIQFEQHERRVLEAVMHPSLATVEAAIAADPTVGRSAAPALADALWRRHPASGTHDIRAPLMIRRRKLNSGSHSLIDFVGVGPPKTGTTWLHTCLFGHPHLCLPGRKETHFFDRYYDHGVDWYLRHFKCSPGTLRGEIGASYFSSSEALQWIRQHNPECKVIVNLRDPVARAYSFYLLYRRRGEARGDFLSSLGEMPNLLESSRYETLLPRWIEAFGRDHVLILLLQDVAARPEQELHRVHDFLKVEEWMDYDVIGQRIYESSMPKHPRMARVATQIANQLRRKDHHWAVDFAKRMGVGRVYRGGGMNRQLDAESRASLIDRFLPTIEYVEELLDRQLPEWKTVHDSRTALEPGST